MKLKMMVKDEETDGGFSFLDVYIDQEQITGFYIPEDEELDERVINVLYPSLKIITVKAERKITDYLTERFV